MKYQRDGTTVEAVQYSFDTLGQVNAMLPFHPWVMHPDTGAITAQGVTYLFGLSALRRGDFLVRDATGALYTCPANVFLSTFIPA